MNGRAKGQPSREGRRGAVFSVRVTKDERAALELLQQAGGPRALGPWLVWRALGGEPPRSADGAVVPWRRRGGSTLALIADNPHYRKSGS